MNFKFVNYFLLSFFIKSNIYKNINFKNEEWNLWISFNPYCVTFA